MSPRLLASALGLAILFSLAAPAARGDDPPVAHAAAKRCSNFVAYRGDDFRYVARRVTKTGRVSCRRARRMIRSTYGAAGGYHREYPRDENGNQFGRVTVHWRGGWRCSNGAGGAGCSNVKHPRWDISAVVDVVDG